MIGDIQLDRASPVSLTDQLAAQMRARIAAGRLAPGTRLPTLDELERELQVGQGTVRRALELLAREGVIEKRRKLGTFVAEAPTAATETAAATPAEKVRLRQLNVAVVAEAYQVAARDEPKRFLALNESFEAVIAQAGGRCFLVPWQPGESAEVLLARVGPANALFYNHTSDHGDQVLETLQPTGLPLVVCDYPRGPCKVSAVVEDWDWGMRELLRHLLEFGHRRLALASYYQDGPAARPWPWAAEREAVFLDVARREGLPVDESDIYRDDQFRHRIDEDPGIIAAGRRVGERIFASGRKYTAVIGVNDCLALGVAEAAQARGLRVPEELSLAGFDNHVTARQQGLTSLKPANEEDGRTAAEMLIEQYLRPRPERALTAVNKPILVVRRSTGPAAEMEEKP